jgi:glycosyltransferase involved in cell wall biosynthesis
VRAVALVITYGRVELCELIACWARQTVEVPLVICVDGETLRTLDLAANVHVHTLPAGLGSARSIGPVRAAAVDFARHRFELRPDDAIIVLDDDDYYHPQHTELTLGTLRSAIWTGARRSGLQLERGAAPKLLEGITGHGPHAAWGLRLAAYD